MDYNNRVGSKKGSGGIAGDAEANQYRRERLRNLLLSKVDIEADPYVIRNHMGILECKLCLTTHFSEGSYLTHTHGRKHQFNLMKRVEAEKRATNAQEDKTKGISDLPKRKFIKIGKPAYKITKIRDPISLEKGLTFHLKYPKVKDGITPCYRLMSSFEQDVEPKDAEFQYIIASAEPYENVAFKVPSLRIDLKGDKTWDFWDHDTKEYFIQILFEK